jgi:uncharacterized membrane protein
MQPDVAATSAYVLVVWISLWIVFGLPVTGLPLPSATGRIINDLVCFLIVAGGFLLWISLSHKAYKGRRFKLPVLANIAEKNS